MNESSREGESSLLGGVTKSDGMGGAFRPVLGASPDHGAARARVGAMMMSGNSSSRHQTVPGPWPDSSEGKEPTFTADATGPCERERQRSNCGRRNAPTSAPIKNPPKTYTALKGSWSMAVCRPPQRRATGSISSSSPRDPIAV